MITEHQAEVIHEELSKRRVVKLRLDALRRDRYKITIGAHELPAGSCQEADAVKRALITHYNAVLRNNALLLENLGVEVEESLSLIGGRNP